MSRRTNADDASIDTEWFGDEGGSDAPSSMTVVGGKGTVIGDVDTAELSYEQIIELLGGENVVSVSELDPRRRIENKDELINIPFIITNVRLNPTGDFGVPWVVVTCKTMTNELVWFTDGSTGIAAQLVEMGKRNPTAKAVLVPKGLVKSTYNTVDGEGNPIVASTYYLNTAK